MDPFSDNLDQINADEQAFTAPEGVYQEPAAAVEQDSSAGFKKEDGQQAVCRITPDGRILTANQAFCSRLNMNEIVRGSNILDYFPSSEKGLLSRRFLLAHHHQKSFHIKLFPAAATSAVALEMEIRPQDNSLYLHEISRTPAGKKVKQLPARDIILMVEQIPLPVMLYNKVHEAQYVNNNFLVFAGYNSKEEVLALQEGVLFPAQEEILKQLFLTICGAKTSARAQLQLRTRSGTERWIEAAASIIPDKALYMVVLQDISQLKLQEKVLNERQAEMEMFTDRAFHDLKGPINSLMALNTLVEHEFGEDQEVMEYFRHYHQGITRLHRTLHDLLTLSRIQQAEPVLKPVSLPKMVEECLLSFRNLPSFYKIRFIKEIDVQLQVFTEENLLRTIVQNLLENAIKYSCEKDPEVRIMAYRHKKGFWLEVSDNGIGIPESLQSKVFDRFFRATTKAGGSGLGLYLLREAVSRLKGEVRLQSKEEKGTTVSVFIPSH